ncbi:MAG: hypothetical protein QXG10_01805 [Candidatus Hadarchaeales archaeon]
MVLATAAMLLPSPVAVASPGVSPSTVRVKGDTRYLFTFTVTNETSDNVDNVRIIISGNPSPSFNTALGGGATAENLRLAADNMENAEIALKMVGENLKLAAENLKTAGQALKDAATYLGTVRDRASILGWENVPNLIDQALTNLDLAGDNLAADTADFSAVVYLLFKASENLRLASGNGKPGLENMSKYNQNAGENLDNAAFRMWAAKDNLDKGYLRGAAENLENTGSWMVLCGTNLSTNNAAMGTAMQNAGNKLKLAAQALLDAATFENNAATKMVEASNYLLSAGGLIEAADSDLKSAADNIENAAALMDVGDSWGAAVDNLFKPYDNLVKAADNLGTAATLLGAALGGTELGKAANYMTNAAENLKKATMNLETAGDQIILAAEQITAASVVITSTADSLGPEGWAIASDSANDLRFNTSDASKHIAPGGSKTFSFIWTTPGVGNIENVYTLKIYTYKPGSATPTKDYSVTVTVDGKVPTVTIRVTQSGVSENNLVGTVYDNGLATVTIVASEAVSLDNVHIENSTGGVLVDAMSLSTTDNITFTATFTAGAWDDVGPKVVVSKAVDGCGNENTSGMTQTFTVDTRGPVFIDNGFAKIGYLRTNVTKAGTTTVYAYVDNDGSKQIYGRVEDNYNDTENAAWCTVYVNGTLASRDPDDNFYGNFTLNDGLNTITLKAVDRVGNETEVVFENYYVDTQAPTISFDTIAGKTWTDGVKITDNKPQIKVIITDPGYSACTGLGVAYENRFVYLDNDDNLNNGWMWQLENKDNWNPATGVFENVIDNFSKPCTGLPEGTYYVIVIANDNLPHAGDNENWVIASRSFVIDITPPSVPSPTQSLNPLAGTSMTNPLVSVETTLTIRGEGLIAEAGATIKIYIRNAATGVVIATDTTTIGTDGKWSKTITLPEGGVTLQIEVTCIDEAGNESEPVLYGFVLLDASAPALTITAPCSVNETYTTSDVTVVVSGSITKDTWESYNTGTKAVTATVQVGSATPGVLTINSDGTFSVSAALSEGTNTITIRAVDSAGNGTSGTITVVRTVTPWATYAIIIVIIALILAAIAIFRKK